MQHGLSRKHPADHRGHPVGVVGGQRLGAADLAAGFDISVGSIQGVRDGYITAVLDQQPYLQGFYGVLSAVLQKKYGLGGVAMFTSTGSMTKANVDLLEALVKTGIR